METPVCKSTEYYRKHKDVLNELARERHKRRYARQKIEAALAELKILKERLEVAITDAEEEFSTLQPRKTSRRDVPVILPH